MVIIIGKPWVLDYFKQFLPKSLVHKVKCHLTHNKVLK